MRTEEEAQDIIDGFKFDNAYPITIEVSYGCSGGKICSYRHGLSKRELFAAMAMQGILADPNASNPKLCASLAVRFADALIKQLNNGKEED